MNPNACLKSLNSNTRCRFPFTTLQPSSLRSPAAISCFDNFPLFMDPPVPGVSFVYLHGLLWLTVSQIDPLPVYCSFLSNLILYTLNALNPYFRYRTGQKTASIPALDPGGKRLEK